MQWEVKWAVQPDEEENFVDWLIAAKGWLPFGGISQVFIEEKRDPDEVVAVHVSGPDGVSANLEWLVAEKGWNRFGGIDEVDLNLANFWPIPMSNK